MLDIVVQYLASFGVTVKPNRSHTQFVVSYGNKWGVYDWEQLKFLESEFRLGTFPDWFASEEKQFVIEYRELDYV